MRATNLSAEYRLCTWIKVASVTTCAPVRISLFPKYTADPVLLTVRFICHGTLNEGDIEVVNTLKTEF